MSAAEIFDKVGDDMILQGKSKKISSFYG